MWTVHVLTYTSEFIFFRYGKWSHAYVAFPYSYENEVYDGDIMMPTHYFNMQLKQKVYKSVGTAK